MIYLKNNFIPEKNNLSFRFLTTIFVVLQVLEDLLAIWDWILIEKLHIPYSERNMYSALIVVPETFDNRGNYV